jgi:Domain of unknown function (DUF6894)
VPRYYFDLVDSKTVSDEGGSELPGDSEAMDVAEELARRLRAAARLTNPPESAIPARNAAIRGAATGTRDPSAR